MAIKWTATSYGYQGGEYELHGDRDGFTVFRGDEAIDYGRTLDEAKAAAESDRAGRADAAGATRAEG